MERRHRKRYGKVEDYLRCILEISRAKGYARVKDIAAALGVKPPTVVQALRKLSEQGLVNYEKYGGVTLTSAGRAFAEATSAKHEIVKRFLELLDLPGEVLERDAHELEHALDPLTLARLKKLTELLKETEEGREVLARLRQEPF
ncbi:MAG: metal-dependent transcriptional regulator [Acidilobaceae archaeon]